MRMLRIPDESSRDYTNYAEREPLSRVLGDLKRLAFDDKPGEPFPRDRFDSALDKLHDPEVMVGINRKDAVEWWLLMGIESGLLPLPLATVRTFVERYFKQRPRTAATADDVHAALRHAPLQQKDRRQDGPEPLVEDIVKEFGTLDEFVNQGAKQSSNMDTIAQVLAAMDDELTPGFRPRADDPR